jgi:glycosyltransferase involved in cell wall biosynthesis
LDLTYRINAYQSARTARQLIRRHFVRRRFPHFAEWKRLILNAERFDRDFYLAANQDVSRSKADPLAHFLLLGGFEGRDPHPLVDAGACLRAARREAANGVNPVIAMLKQYGRSALPEPQQPSSLGYTCPTGLILCITNVKGGGIARYLKDRSDDDPNLALLVPDATGPKLTNSRGRQLAAFRPDHSPGELLNELQPVTVEFHSAVGWSLPWLDELTNEAARRGISLTTVIHDYSAICPRVNLVGSKGVYCYEPDTRTCNSCIASGREPAAFEGNGDYTWTIEEWRRWWGSLLARTNHIVAPCHDTGERFSNYFPGLNIDIVGHPDKRETNPLPRPPKDSKFRVAIVGGINRSKGAKLLTKIAEAARINHLQLEFIIIGYSTDSRVHRLNNVKITGPYREQHADRLLAEAQCHVALFPALWPETYSYALTVPMAAKLPIMAFRLGAQAERLEGYPNSELLPLSAMNDPAYIANRLFAFAKRS